MVDGDGKGSHVLVIDSNDGALQTHTASSHTLGHFLFGLSASSRVQQPEDR